MRSFLLGVAPLVVLVITLAFTAIPTRLQMESRAYVLVAQHPRAEQTAVFLALHSTSWSDKQREIDANIVGLTL